MHSRSKCDWFLYTHCVILSKDYHFSLFWSFLPHTFSSENRPIVSDRQLLSLERLLHRPSSLKYLVKLLQRTTFRLRKQEVEDSCLHRTPDDENDVCLPSDVMEGDWPGELVEQTTGVHSQAGESHSLSSPLERQDLDRIKCLQGQQPVSKESQTKSGSLGCYTYVSLKTPVAAVTPIQTMQQPVIENSISGLRPMRSTNAAPVKANANWKHA
ncbi:hypothetical protein AC578_9349 [Pseudocercospora eumusae]|uniref:Uncharacterized protein n=1 Tax=Pseudocercospora eumusae TaxID=321146 RepID=A0A139GYV2_9PEZI|nr:hypothetical protein AC578_9349 [Pseudocercospora eumusae]